MGGKETLLDSNSVVQGKTLRKRLVTGGFVPGSEFVCYGSGVGVRVLRFLSGIGQSRPETPRIAGFIYGPVVENQHMLTAVDKKCRVPISLCRLHCGLIFRIL